MQYVFPATARHALPATVRPVRQVSTTPVLPAVTASVLQASITPARLASTTPVLPAPIVRHPAATIPLLHVWDTSM